jgi:hypothetical protein
VRRRGGSGWRRALEGGVEGRFRPNPAVATWVVQHEVSSAPDRSEALGKEGVHPPLALILTGKRPEPGKTQAALLGDVPGGDRHYAQCIASLCVRVAESQLSDSS